jgi:amidase
VVGFKPPYGRVPQGQIFNLDFYCHTGPLARTVGDAALMENVLAGPHSSDVASLRPKLRIPAKLAGVKGWRIAYSVDLDYFAVDAEVRANTADAIQVFKQLGCSVEEVKLGWTSASGKAAWNYLCHIFGASMTSLAKSHGDLMTPYARAFIDAGRRSTATEFVASLKTVWDMYATFGTLLEHFDAFVCPTLAKPALRADDPLDYDQYLELGKPLPDALAWCMTYPFNMLSRCPVISVPSGFARNGVPTGIQIVGRTYDDVRVFRAAAAFERASPWLHDVGHRPRL